MWDAARSPGEDQPKFDIRVSRFRYHIVRFSSTSVLSQIIEWFGDRSEGVNAKEHYLICGVQGDFTRKLVEDPPQYIWTRQLKVFICVDWLCVSIMSMPPPVCRRFAHISDIQAWYSSVYRYWPGGCIVDLSAGINRFRWSLIFIRV